MTIQTHTFEITGLNCGACAAKAENVAAELAGVKDAHVNLATSTVGLSVGQGTPLNSVFSALERAGYAPVSDTVQLVISGMHCGSCVGRIEATLEELPGVRSAHVNLATQRADVTVVRSLVDEDALIKTINDAGYNTSSIASDRDQAQQEAVSEADETRRAALIAAALTLPVFVLEMGGHLVPPFHRFVHATIGMQASWLIQCVLTTLVLAWPGQNFFRLGMPALMRGAPDMNALVALGTLAAWAFSTVALFAPDVLPEGTRAVYYEAAAVIVTLILLGRYLEARAKGRAGQAIRKLIDLRPATALVERDGALVELPAEAIKPGDVFQVRPGDRVATDAIVVSGASHIDESAMTGEPMPVPKGPGDALIGATINGDATLRVRATSVGADTVLSRIIAMVQDAQGTRLPVQDLVNAIALRFVPVVMGIALAAVFAWLIFGPSPALPSALVAGVSVLIIACPCAMGLATPMSIMVGTGKAARMGVLFRRGDALQRLQDVKVVAFDKTGTLTIGKPEITRFAALDGYEEDTVLAICAAIEAHANHPVAKAVLAFAHSRNVKTLSADHVTAMPGFGVCGIVDGKSVVIGTEQLMQREGVALEKATREIVQWQRDAMTVFYVAIDGHLAAAFGVADTIKPEAPTVIEALQSKGIRVAMITGDNEMTARAIAKAAGIDEVVSGVLPDGKVEAINTLKAQHGILAFVGDGINDAPALAAADVGIAIGTGTDIAIEAGDLVLMSGALEGVMNAIHVSKATMRNIRQNLVWAFGYNILLIPVAAGALYPAFGLMLSPILAAAAMALSSVLVVTNALRLNALRSVA